MTELQKDAVNNLLQSPKLPFAVHQYAWLCPADVPFSQTVRQMCADNRCGKYGTCWTCPPGIGEWEALRDECHSHDGMALVLTTKHDLEDSFDFEGMTQAAHTHKQLDSALALALGELGLPFVLYSAGGCELCDRCTYPDAPCRFPDRVHKPMEACGIDVVSLARTCGIRYNNGPDTVTYFSMLLL